MRVSFKALSIILFISSELLAGNAGLGVSTGARITAADTPIIISTLPADGSTTLVATPHLRVVFNMDMDTSKTDASMVFVPAGLTITQLRWIDARTMDIEYTGQLTQFGAYRVDFTDFYFRSVQQVGLQKHSGYAFNYGNMPPEIIIVATATPNVGTTDDMIMFNVLASDPNNDTLTYTWDFGDAGTGAGQTVPHRYTAPGVYLAMVVVTDGNGGMVSVPLVVQIGAGAGPTPPTPTLTWNVFRGNIGLNFVKPGRDKIMVQGTLDLPAGFDPRDKDVLVDIGGVTASFKMDKNGRGKTGLNKFQLRRKLKKKQFLGGAVRITINLRGAFAAALADNGLTRANTARAGSKVTVPATLFLNGTNYVANPEFTYKNRNSRNGRAVRRTAIR